MLCRNAAYFTNDISFYVLNLIDILPCFVNSSLAVSHSYFSLLLLMIRSESASHLCKQIMSEVWISLTTGALFTNVD